MLDYDKSIEDYCSPMLQAKLALIMVGAYSILEELKLQINASNEKPSTINGVWNPDVLNELRERLNNYNVVHDYSFPWCCRGESKRPFKSAVNNKNKCLNDNASNHDFYITISDAILELSYIRSNIGAHKSSSTLLTLYDAENAFRLTETVLKQYFQVDKEVSLLEAQ